MTGRKYANFHPNDYIEVKPTESGWKQIADGVDRINASLSQFPFVDWRAELPKRDSDGYIKGSFWCIVKLFNWGQCVTGCDVFFSDMRVIIPKNRTCDTIEVNDQARHHSSMVPDRGGGKMTRPGDLCWLMEIAEIPIQFLSTSAMIKKVNAAKWAVTEIRRLRAKANRLTRVHNEEDASGNHIGEHYVADDDLILEQEI